jgi:hypothetical protein
VSLYTSHDSATLCIQVPTNEISWPPKKSWKLRCRNERNAPAILDAVGVVLNVPIRRTWMRRKEIVPADQRRMPVLIIRTETLMSSADWGTGSSFGHGIQLQREISGGSFQPLSWLHFQCMSANSAQLFELLNA